MLFTRFTCQKPWPPDSDIRDDRMVVSASKGRIAGPLPMKWRIRDFSDSVSVTEKLRTGTLSRVLPYGSVYVIAVPTPSSTAFTYSFK